MASYGIMCTTNFVKIGQVVKKLKGWTCRHTGTATNVGSKYYCISIVF
jgi:hypothetical protein